MRTRRTMLYFFASFSLALLLAQAFVENARAAEPEAASGAPANASSAAAKRSDVALPPKDKFDLYLLIGQSNMAGRGEIEAVDKQPHPRVLSLNAQGEWVPAVDPLHADKPTAGVGLGSTFARVMADANPDVTIGLVPCAVGGTPLARWMPGEDLYQQALRRAEAAQASGTFRGILWHQGEADSRDPQRANSYGERLTKMIAAWRKALAAPELPFVAGELGRFIPVNRNGQNFSRVPVVNAQLHAVAAAVPHVAVASSEGLGSKDDQIHFDSPALRELGRRYAAAMLKLQGKQPATAKKEAAGE